MDDPSKPSEGPEPRIETGVVSFGDDWPGVFIRGDNAHGYLHSLQHIFEAVKQLDPDNEDNQLVLLSVLHTESLLVILRESGLGQVKPADRKYPTQYLKEFKDCKKPRP